MNLSSLSWANILRGLPSTPNAQPPNTQAGIYRPEGGPAGGYAMPPQTYTSHTSSMERLDGERTGTGGGHLVTANTPESELLLARPDLTGAKQFAQFDSTVDTSKVTPVVRAQALRSMGTGE